MAKNIKHFVRDSWLTASYYTGLSHLYQALAGRKYGVVSYHNVLPVSTLPAFDTYNVDVTAAIFDKQLQFLKKHFRVQPIQELENPLAEGIFLTFDDGMRNNYEILVPILAKHDISALFAICPAMVDGELPYIWRDYLFLLLHQAISQDVWLPLNGYQSLIRVSEASLNSLTRQLKQYVYSHQIADIYGIIWEICKKNQWSVGPISCDELRYEFMTWPQIQELTQKGHQVASHTQTHRVLRFLSQDEKKKELESSKKRLEEKLNHEISLFVYPYGSSAEIDQATVNAVDEAGYRGAFMNIQRPLLTPSALAQPRFAFPPIASSAHLYAIASGYKFSFR